MQTSYENAPISLAAGAPPRTPLGDAYDAPPDALVGWRGACPSPGPSPRRLRHLASMPSAPRFRASPDAKFWRRHCIAAIEGRIVKQKKKVVKHANTGT
jgi:hypothetical protein